MRTATAPAISPATGPLRGRVRVPGDKSIAHRAAIVGALASGRTVLEGMPGSGDLGSTLSAIEALGVGVRRDGDHVTIEGRGWDAMRGPDGPVDCGRSGTTMRLLLGAVAGAGVATTLTGDPQLLARPMDRVAEPLRLMGARVDTTDGRPPVTIEPAPLQGIRYELPVASAQVKSAILLAGLRAEGRTTVVEARRTRDHTERLLGWLGVPISSDDGVGVARSDVEGFELEIPGDSSSAAVVLAAAAAVPRSVVVVEDVCINHTRTAFLGVLERMGAAVEVDRQEDHGPEPAGFLGARGTMLRGVEIRREEVPDVIDELPLIGALGALAEGSTVVRGAAELRVKESDRIAGLVRGLRALGIEAEELDDGFAVRGGRPSGGAVDAAGDHRLAMAFSVVALGAAGPVQISGLERVADSFPGFVETLESLR